PRTRGNVLQPAIEVSRPARSVFRISFLRAPEADEWLRGWWETKRFARTTPTPPRRPARECIAGSINAAEARARRPPLLLESAAARLRVLVRPVRSCCEQIVLYVRNSSR